jgi:C-terminal processing protease CtpA/Prc
LLNSRSTFTSYYQLVFGLDSTVQVELIDTLGRQQTVQRRVKYPLPSPTVKSPPAKDSVKRADTVRTPKSTPKASPTSFRYKGLMMDTTESIAYMVLNTFSNGEGIGTFIRKSFRKIERYQIQHLIIDIRNNGGGNVSNSNLLLKYVKRAPFRIADSLYAVNKTYKHGKYIQYSFWQWPLMTVITKKDAAGRRHFSHYERHTYKPKRSHAYRGQIYLITGYQSFSASSIVAHQLRGQSNVTLVGEPTGGAEYGNNAWLTPMVTLPNTGVRFSLPRFRLVMDKTLEKTGQGVPVDVVAKPTVMSIRKNIDIKMATAGKLIQQKSIQ